jgi:hypothetical protein
MSRAAVLVDRTWPQIHRLAFALLEFRRLSGDQICELLGGQGSNGST